MIIATISPAEFPTTALGIIGGLIMVAIMVARPLTMLVEHAIKRKNGKSATPAGNANLVGEYVKEIHEDIHGPRGLVSSQDKVVERLDEISSTMRESANGQARVVATLERFCKQMENQR